MHFQTAVTEHIRWSCTSLVYKISVWIEWLNSFCSILCCSLRILEFAFDRFLFPQILFWSYLSAASDFSEFQLVYFSAKFEFCSSLESFLCKFLPPVSLRFVNWFFNSSLSSNLTNSGVESRAWIRNLYSNKLLLEAF